ncbi:bidirectional sugar transporter SWEET15-like [Trifolium pratense]|nr:bidirectional sugar transporter SWEET15-like [Trifolium pratense]
MAINVGLLLSIFLVIEFAITKKNRVMILGWISTSVSIGVFAAPLSVMVQVIRTRSVTSMPLALSVCLIVSAGVWFCYGVFVGDMNIYLPNVIGLTLGAIQVLLYCYYSCAGRETDIERAVVQENLREGGDNLVGGDAPVIELVEVGGRLVEVAEGGGREVGSVTAGGEEGERGEVTEGGGGEVSEDTEERGVEDQGELGGDAPAIELVEVGGRLVEVAEGGGREVGSVTAGGEEGERGEVAEGGADRGPVAGEEEEREEVAEGGGGEVSEDIEERGVEDRG